MAAILLVGPSGISLAIADRVEQRIAAAPYLETATVPSSPTIQIAEATSGQAATGDESKSESKQHTSSGIHHELMPHKEIANIVFNETRSLAGPNIHNARVNIAHAVLNGKAKYGRRRPPTASSHAHVPRSEKSIYDQCMTAAQQAVNERQQGVDPTNGATNFNFRHGTFEGPFFGLSIQTHVGPLKNHYPTRVLPRSNIFANTYGGGE